MTADSRKELFTGRIAAGSRTYFFDVKESKDGTKYLVISESRKTSTDQDYTHSRVMVFEEHLQAFVATFQEAVNFLCAKAKTYTVDEIRREYPKAYARWMPDEDHQLKVKYSQGASIDELARHFQRKASAIRSRLRKLGLFASQGNTNQVSLPKSKRG